jgi:hypothetical protein
MNKILTCLAIALAVGACEPRGGAPADPAAASVATSAMPRTIHYDSPQGPQTYVVPATDNTCAPEPQRFISVIGEVTYRVKDCVKDEWDYFPESQRARIQRLVNQCRAKCGG